MWLLPTKNRPENLRRFLTAAREMGTATPGWIVVNRDDWEQNRAVYEDLRRLMLDGWDYLLVDADSYGEAVRKAYPSVTNCKWVGLLADDLSPASSNWDVLLLRQLPPYGFVSSNDGWQAQAGRMHGATIFSRAILDAVGWLFPPKLKHIFHDDIWEGIGRQGNCWKICMDIMVRHLHEALEGVKGPTVDPQSDLWKHDEAVFKEWVATESGPTMQRVHAMLELHGVRTLHADFTGLDIMVATPCGSGRYEYNYVKSLFQTLGFFQSKGCTARWTGELYTADIAYARNKIFAMFLRSPCTHLLMIDDDMGWEMDAVIRLFAAKKDFVSIAGPKKRYPLSFAASWTDDAFNPLDLKWETDGSYVMEVSEVGAAFTLITRACAERLVAAYPELRYSGLTGEKEYGVFNPLVLNDRWYSEDFAFCRRWRQIGGRCFIVPDIPLKHTGTHTFEGRFIDHTRALPAPTEFKEAAE